MIKLSLAPCVLYHIIAFNELISYERDIVVERFQAHPQVRKLQKRPGLSHVLFIIEAFSAVDGGELSLEFVHQELSLTRYVSARPLFLLSFGCRTGPTGTWNFMPGVICWFV